MECRKQVADGQVHRTVMLPTVDFCFKELMLNERVRKSFIAALLVRLTIGLSEPFFICAECIRNKLKKGIPTEPL